MDRDAVLQQFGAIEKKVENLIETCKRLEAARAELAHTNQELTAQLQEKVANEKQSEELKVLIRSRIDSLMGRLDEFTEE